MVGILRGVDVDTADDIVAVEDRVRETFTIQEVSGVHLEIGEVRSEIHLHRPIASAIEPGRRSDVVDTRHPCLMVPIVMLRSERFEMEAWTFETYRDHELLRNE